MKIQKNILTPDRQYVKLLIPTNDEFASTLNLTRNRLYKVLATSIFKGGVWDIIPNWVDNGRQGILFLDFSLGLLEEHHMLPLYPLFKDRNGRTMCSRANLVRTWGGWGQKQRWTSTIIQLIFLTVNVLQWSCKSTKPHMSSWNIPQPKTRSCRVII